ncbi:MAG TPA: DUF5752 family protein [Candidatus Deferrimicrobiaceae bacterium]|nr:DUF5752 family protein [Candidatus Deferrimicrobiaceae bacterium]
MKPFEVKDCALLSRMSGLSPAINLRELRERIAVCSENVLFHHFCEPLLRPTFDNPDYRNDFAVWVKLYLSDRVLAERLGILDPFSMSSLEELRLVTLDIIDERLSELTVIPSAAPGDDFFFLEATTIVFDTGERIRSPRELSVAIQRMTNGSIYYHFLEARRRTPLGKDDFTAWLKEEEKKNLRYISALESIDFFFHSLSHLKEELVNALAKAERKR